MTISALVLVAAVALVVLALLGSRRFLDRPFERSEIESQPPAVNKLLGQANRINRYFLNAVEAWILADDEAARLSALTAAKVAASVQRRSLVDYLTGMASDWALAAPGDRKVVPRKLRALAAEISEKDWGVPDIITAKKTLFAVDEEYAKALDNADPEVFVRRHPPLFDDPAAR